MKTQFEFRSSEFPLYEGEQEQINPGLWGKRLAEYFVRKLSEKGIKTEEIIAEDWGWYIPVQNEGFRLAICCGHQDGDDDEFVCFTDPSTPVVKKFFKKIDATAQLTRLTGGDAADSLCGSRNQRSGMERADLATNCRFEKFRARSVPRAIDDRSVAAVWNARLLT